MTKFDLIRDKLQLLKVINVVRLGNASKLWISYHRSRITQQNRHRGMPMAISIEPTTACNLGCPECPSGLKQFTRPTGNLQMEVFEKLLSQLSKHLIYITFYFQGEPFINPRLS